MPERDPRRAVAVPGLVAPSSRWRSRSPLANHLRGIITSAQIISEWAGVLTHCAEGLAELFDRVEAGREEGGAAPDLASEAVPEMAAGLDLAVANSTSSPTTALATFEEFAAEPEDDSEPWTAQEAADADAALSLAAWSATGAVENAERAEQGADSDSTMSPLRPNARVRAQARLSQLQAQNQLCNMFCIWKCSFCEALGESSRCQIKLQTEHWSHRCRAHMYTV